MFMFKHVSRSYPQSLQKLFKTFKKISPTHLMLKPHQLKQLSSCV